MPWRVVHANVLDTVFTEAFLLILMFVAFFVPDEDANDVVAWFAFSLVLFMLVCLPGVGGFGFFTYLLQRKKNTFGYSASA